MELRRIDVQKVRAYGSKTVFVQDSQGGLMSNSMAVGLAAGLGADARK
jgi:hypothetical protein